MRQLKGTLGLLWLCIAVWAAGCQAPANMVRVTQPSPQLPVSTQEATKPVCAKTLNIAHRGARSLAPENTLAAARKALAIGADLWELDVAMSADGELFVVHDDTLTRTSNVQELFPDRQPWTNHLFTFAEISRLDFGSWYVERDPFRQIAAGNVTPAEQAAFRGEHAPSLREALTFTRDNRWRVNIEIKDLSNTPGDATVVEQTVALVHELGLADRVLISSFNHSYLERVKAADPRLPTGALVSDADPDPAALLRRLHAQAYNPDASAIRPDEVTALRDQGFDVYIWTVNDEKTMRTLVAAGATGIFTDFPQRLKPIVDESCR